MAIPASQDRNVACDIKRNFKRILVFTGIFLLNPIAWILWFLDLVIYFVFFGFIWQLIVKNSKFKPFILTRMWINFGYSNNDVIDDKKSLIKNATLTPTKKNNSIT